MVVLLLASAVPTAGTVGDGEARPLADAPVDRWVEDIVTFATAYGFDTFVFAGDLGQLERFAHEVVPAARELVAGERG